MNPTRFLPVLILFALITAGCHDEQESADKLAFVACSDAGPCEVHTMNADGSSRDYLADGRRFAWSPDGSRLAIAQNSDLSVVELDGSPPVKIIDGEWNGQIAWSPNADRLAFYSCASSCYCFLGDDCSIVVINANGNDKQTLTAGYPFAWSHDGHAVIYQAPNNMDIQSVSIESRVIEKVAEGQIEGGEITSPALSPDFSKIAFIKRCCEGVVRTQEVYVMDADGSGITPLVSDTIVNGDAPEWSPDSGRLLYAVSRWMYVVAADGSSSSELPVDYARDVSADDSPDIFDYDLEGMAWSPDGMQIAFGYHDDIWVMNADGSNQRNLTNTPDRHEQLPSWQPR